jgi:phage-related minor tail protein
MDALEPTAPAYNQVTWQQYHKKQIEMSIRDKATPSIQAVANELDISLDEAKKHQAYIDDLKKGGKKSGRKSRRHGKKSRRHSKKSRKCRR